jgi:hypothetical protein
VRLRPACSLRRHARHDSAARDCTSEHGENYFDWRLISGMAIIFNHGRQLRGSSTLESLQGALNLGS